ncbi:MAG: hypothetical protein HY985_14055 [Magnetospirillum sp.]|nr:hypothetical protein [Magnetospirillum sp.]
MAAAVPFIPAIMAAAATVAGSVSQQQQTKAAQKSQADQYAAQVAVQNARLAQDQQTLREQQAQEAKRQRNLLDRQMASQRAAMGAFGLSGGEGSAAAVLSGMTRQVEENIADAGTLTDLRMPIAPAQTYGGSGAGSSAAGIAQGLQLANQVFGMFSSR